MSILSSGTVLEILRQHENEWKVDPSPREGHLRIHEMQNDVKCAIENMGGIARAAQTLRVSVEEIDRWIDEHYVPESHVRQVRIHTGYLESLQWPTFYVSDGVRFWPHVPSSKELALPGGIRVYYPLKKTAKPPEYKGKKIWPRDIKALP
ncbi:hypothetical protein Q8A64_00120 [Oxalobacteraceae bacterium R-40]|uniref:Uncharacterized protein n=1 Tax=Keguizhuia sedimenti TaxID=3064264 RepID=A0ABU1BIG8_9BURK|nr:hypothetical protein [Oxalobacteraceae bacterium R-40]